MAELKYPGVYVEEIESGVHAIEGVPTSIAAFVGGTRSGPANRAQAVTSWTEYERGYGRLDKDGLLGWSVYQFFNNGGSRAVVLRLAKKSALLPASGRGGAYLLDKAGPYNLLCVPGETNPAVIARLQKFCRDRRAFLIADCERTATADSLRNGPDPAITGEDGINAALYFPWVRATAGKLRAAVPPCGYVAGIYARTDASRGVWKAPAGSAARLSGASGLTAEVKEREAGELGRRAVNCIRRISGSDIVIFGARTLHGADETGSEWKYVPVRRTTIYVLESIRRGTTWVVFEPNHEPLWAQVRLKVGAFMFMLFRQGAFAGDKPEQAYFVKCGRDTMSRKDVENGIVRIEVGFAPSKPAEFIVVRIEHRANVDT